MEKGPRLIVDRCIPIFGLGDGLVHLARGILQGGLGRWSPGTSAAKCFGKSLKLEAQCVCESIKMAKSPHGAVDRMTLSRRTDPTAGMTHKGQPGEAAAGSGTRHMRREPSPPPSEEGTLPGCDTQRGR